MTLHTHHGFTWVFRHAVPVAGRTAHNPQKGWSGALPRREHASGLSDIPDTYDEYYMVA